MKIITQSHEILDPINGTEILKKIERIARLCYKSEDKITEDSCLGMVKGLLARGHEAMLEHVSISVKFITDRGVSHELARHRLASFAQESTRYVNYGKSGIELIEPVFTNSVFDSEFDRVWLEQAGEAELTYVLMLEAGFTPQDARSVLPNSLKTEIVVTTNLREWRHILALRAVGTTGKPHPQMQALMIPLLQEFKAKIPVVFDDLVCG